MDISSEVANFHVRTDSKNLVTMAKKIFTCTKNDPHDFNIAKGLVQEELMILLIQTENCLEDCLTNAGKLLAVDIHSDFRTFVAQKVSCSIGCKAFLLSLSADSSSEPVLVDVLCELVEEVLVDGPCELDVDRDWRGNVGTGS